MQFASGRARKIADVSRSLSSRNARQANQAAIWSVIEQKAERMQASSKTGAMAAIYQQHAAVLEHYFEPVRSQYSGLHGTE